MAGIVTGGTNGREPDGGPGIRCVVPEARLMERVYVLHRGWVKFVYTSTDELTGLG